MSSTACLEFYQEVRLARPRAENTAHLDRLGVIVGIGDEPGQPISYGVLFPPEVGVIGCDRDELEPTGRRFRREDIYDDSRWLRVRLDENGGGRPA